MSTIENIAVNIKERIGVQHFNVLLDDAQDIYYSGKIITGKVGIIFNSPVTITSIKVLCKGEAQVHFTSRSAGFKRRFKTEEIYLHEEIDLIDANVEIKNNDFSFNLQLPEKLPCSFEGRYGRVRYSICASLNTNENLKIYSDTLPFTVAPIFDLNNHPLAPLPISENCTKTLMGHAEPFTVSVFLPVRGYVPGQTIPLKVNFKNESNVEFKKLRVVLKKVVLYRSMENVRKHKEIVVEIEQPIDKNNNVYNSEFDVPAIPPTGTICNLIDVEYKLKIEAFADINEWYYKIFYKNLKIRIDIIIGSLPLKNYEDPIDLSDDSRNSKEQSVLNVEKGRLKYQRSRIYRSSKPDLDETDEERDKESIQEFSPMYRVYEFKHSNVKATE
ncbi:arrestin domain-containing protein 17-like [Microplitis demolitor]|uniref:arrestin domain-containing protein 17-like n=1 Tax=Microplitis demolitor TaxID=69319 RepID=UPI0006D4FD98|nr:arrestin domain-containing protein 17-like [Microplitis demolitor]